MDSPDVTAITKIVKKVGTEFKSASDEDISFWIDLRSFAGEQRDGADADGLYRNVFDLHSRFLLSYRP